MCLCACVSACWRNRGASMCRGSARLWAAGRGIWLAGGEVQPHPPFRAMTRQVMWLLVLTEAPGSQEQEGSVLGPHACFIVRVGVPHCWMQTNQCWNIRIINRRANQTIFSSFICLCDSSGCFCWHREEGKYVSLWLSLSRSPVIHVVVTGCKSDNKRRCDT